MTKILAAAVALILTAAPCRAAVTCAPDPQWISSSAASVPAERLAAHLARPARRVLPTMLTVYSVASWIGVVYRDYLAAPACYATGSVAFYYVGPEDKPELDFVKTIEAGGEAGLKARLLELRWYDPKDGLRHSWADAELADKLGWFTDERGERGGPWPIPSAAAVNVLY